MLIGLASACLAGLAMLSGTSAASGTTLPPPLSLRTASASHKAFLMVTPVGSYVMEVMASKGTILGGTPGHPAPNLVVSLIRPHAGPGFELDTYAFHLRASSLTIRGSAVRLRTGTQLGAFGSIDVSLHAGRHSRVVGCGSTLASGRGGKVTGSLRFVPGGSHFGTISRRRLSGALVTVSLSHALGACHGASLTTTAPAEPTLCPHAPLLVAAGGAPLPGGAAPPASGELTDVIAESASGHTTVVVLDIEAKAPATMVTHILGFPDLPAGELSAAGGSATLEPAAAAPFLTGSLSFSGQAIPGAPPCVFLGSGSGSLSAHYDSIGEVALGSVQGFLAE